MNSDTEKRVREAYRQAGRRWPTGPVVMQEQPAPPVEDSIPVFGPGPGEDLLTEITITGRLELTRAPLITRDGTRVESKGITAVGDVIEALDAAPGPVLLCVHDSPGGSIQAFDLVAAAVQRLHARGGMLLVHVQGFAGSTAALLPLLADVTLMEPGSRLYHHSAVARAGGEENPAVAAALAATNARFVALATERTRTPRRALEEWFSKGYDAVTDRYHVAELPTEVALHFGWTSGVASLDEAREQARVAMLDGAITVAKLAVDTLRTTNYAEDGSGNATAGAKLDHTGTALKVAPQNVMVGTRTLEQLLGLMAASNWFPYAGPGANVNALDVSDRAAFVAVGPSVAYTSPDYGYSWTSRTIPAGAYVALGKVGTTYVAVGSAVCATAPSGGTTWTSRSIGTGNWCSVATKSGTLVAVRNDAGATTCASTTDGTTWTPRTIPAGNWRSVAQNGTVFCAVGNSGACATSTDGQSWTSRTVHASNPTLTCVIWASDLGLFVAFADTAANVYTSPDGTTWTQRTTPVQMAPVYGAAWGKNTLVAVGVDLALGQGVMLASNDAVNWVAIRCTFGVDFIPRAVQYVPHVTTNDLIGRFYAAGQHSSGPRFLSSLAFNP